jgi:hypothetical protein
MWRSASSMPHCSDTLHAKRQAPRAQLHEDHAALATTGEVALIDEATGLPVPPCTRRAAGTDLQAAAAVLLIVGAALPPGLLPRLYRLFNWRYQGHEQNPPHVIGQITLRWVYGPVLPEDLLGEIRNRKGISQKHHQWLSDQGLAHLESQIHAVTAIARSSMSYPDFKRRCEAAFAGAALQLGLLLDEFEEGA